MLVYLDCEFYNRTIAGALLAIESAPSDERGNALKMALGEVGDIWPADLAEDEPSAESHHQLDDSGIEFIEGGAPSVSAV